MPAPVLGITAGDPAGIGGELLLTALPVLRGAVPVIFGSAVRLQHEAQQLDLSPCPYPSVPTLTSRPTAPLFCDCSVPDAALLSSGAPDACSGAQALAQLQAAAAALRAGFIDGVVTLPVSKAALVAAGSRHHGHTEFFRDAAGVTDAVMAFAAGSFRVALLTIHEPLHRVPELVTADRLRTVIRCCHDALRRDFAVAAPRLGVLGLNPHAGEDGLLGSTEREVIIPVLAELRAAGLDLDGPLVPDVAFRRRDRYDLLLALYHDQGLIPFKLLAFDTGVNVTLGLPFVRTSVDHGTACDIAGQGCASPASLLAAWELAVTMVRNRHAAH